MFNRNLKKIVPAVTLALLPFVSSGAQAAQPAVLFSAGQPSASANVGVGPAFTEPGVGMVGMNAGATPISQFAQGLRVAGVLEWLKQYSTATISAPDAAGNVTKTQTCATEFRNPATAAQNYRTPLQALASLPYTAPMGHVMATCSAAPFSQAANPLGLLAEAVTISQMVITPTGTSFPTRVKVRVMNPSTGAVLWSALLLPHATMGDPQYGVLIDTNNDGTGELVFLYTKNVTPVGFSGSQTRYTRVVRNGATGAITNTFAWVDVVPM